MCSLPVVLLKLLIIQHNPLEKVADIDCVLLPTGAESTQQENIPPNTPSGAQQSNPLCTLSNPSLMSSAPNILQPLTLNSSNGLLETIFPVDQTPSPESPRGAIGQDNASADTTQCRRRLAMQSRPFSELYSEDVSPFESDITSPDITQNSSEVNSENAVSGNGLTNMSSLGDRTSSRLANSVEIEPPEGTTDQLHNSENASHGSDGGCSTSPQHSSQNSQDLESQPMEITDESIVVGDSNLLTEVPVMNVATDTVLTGSGQRNSIGSIGSIELTEDSPLRILEESERVREEVIAQSRENLLRDPIPGSDDELEQMDIVEDMPVVEPDGSLDTDCSMEDVLNNGCGSDDLTLNETDPLETQPVAVQETELLDVAVGSLLDGDESDPTCSFLQDRESSRSSRAAVQCLSEFSISAEQSETETQSEAVAAPGGSPESQFGNSDQESVTLNPQLTTETSEQQGNNGQEEPMSLLEFVDRIVGDDSTERSNDAMIVESAGCNTQGASATSSEATDSSLETSVATSSATLPVVASEPLCLDAVSLQSASTSEMLVDTPGTVTVDNSVVDGGHSSPHRPPRSKRLSRSSSDPRSSQSRRRGERSRNTPGTANQEENSPRISRPPFVRRITEPVTGDPVRVAWNAESSVTVSPSQGAQSATTMAVSPAVTESQSPTESVVLAVPLSPPPRRTTPSGLTAVVVADGVAEPEAVVTPLPSPEFNSEVGSPTLDNLATAVAVAARSGIESPTTNDHMLIILAEGRQPSSAPSTLQRDVVPTQATVLTNRTPVRHRRSSSQDASVIYATPVSGINGESAEGQSSSLSFPRQNSSTRVTPLSGNRRQNLSSNSAGSSQTRSVPQQSQSLPRDVVISSSVSPDTSASRDHERVNSHSTPGATSLPGPNTNSNTDQSRQAIQNLLLSYCVQSSQLDTSSSSAAETEPHRRAPVNNPRSGSRRSSGQRQQGQPVYVSIQDQQQTSEQQAEQQQPTEEEPLPSSKKSELGCF